MHTLTRTVRFNINPHPRPGDAASSGTTGVTTDNATRNSYAGFPTPGGFTTHYSVDVAVRGEPDPTTGYLLDIKAIDDAACRTLLPTLTRIAQNTGRTDPADTLIELAPALAALLARPLHTLRLRITPFLLYEVHMSSPTTVLLRHRFDFAASHRLHVPTLSDEQNRALFGKCNNPRGHGHNYQFEPCIELTPSTAAPSFSPSQLESICARVILNTFDHKHLNEDTAYFNLAQGGVNPSVENIARVFFDLLSPEFKSTPGARLRSLTVWETDRTSATYPA